MRLAVAVFASLGLVSTARAEPPAPVVTGELGAQLDRYLGQSDFVGAVLVAKDGKVLLTKGYGLADREKNVPWRSDAIVSIGSITKQFTAAAIVKLETEGKVSIQDPIAKYFKDVPEDKKQITLHQLLTHTSGLESDFAGDYEAVGRDAYVARILASKLRSRPGSEYFYANSGYSLLAAIVELASGTGYETYLREHLLLPAGMRETGYRLPKWDPARVPVGYKDGARWGTMLEKPWAPDGPYWALRGNGGIETTLADLAAWARALDGGPVFTDAERKKIQTPYVKEGEGAPSSYGYGWSIATSPWSTKVVQHDGGNGVFSADFRRYVDDHLLVLTATNAGAVKAWKYSEPLARIAHGESVAAAGTAAAPVPLAPGKRADAVKAFVEAINSHDLAAVRAFRAKWMAPRPGAMSDEERDKVSQRMFQEFGTLSIRGALLQEGAGLAVAMTSTSGPPARFTFAFDPDDKITGLRIEAD